MIKKAVVFFIFMLIFSQTYATNGYFSHGFGTQHKGLAGAGVALPLSPLSVALNPAAASFLNSQTELNVALFSPDRKFIVTGNPSGAPGTFGLMPGTTTSDSKYFLVPSAGLNFKINETTAIALALYGNGGMNTNYDANVFYAGKPVGVNLSQMFLSFTIAHQIFKNHSIGISYLLGYQMFEAKGLNSFAMMSSDPQHLSNKGRDNSLGFGMRFGYLGKWMDNLSVGASYQTRIIMSRFDLYRGLFAEQGDFDIPSNWTAGIAYTVYGNITVVADFAQYRYSEINSVANKMENVQNGGLLGLGNGAGFGWDDMNVYRGGIQYSGMEGWIFRAGYSYGKQPIQDTQVLFNILAPAVIENHITFGLSKMISDKKALHVSLMYAPESNVKGPNGFEAPGQQSIELKMMQWDLEIGYTF